MLYVSSSKTDLEMADGGIYATNDNLQPLRAIYYCVSSLSLVSVCACIVCVMCAVSCVICYVLCCVSCVCCERCCVLLIAPHDSLAAINSSNPNS
mgnify:FL=1